MTDVFGAWRATRVVVVVTNTRIPSGLKVPFCVC